MRQPRARCIIDTPHEVFEKKFDLGPARIVGQQCELVKQIRRMPFFIRSTIANAPVFPLTIKTAFHWVLPPRRFNHAKKSFDRTSNNTFLPRRTLGIGSLVYVRRALRLTQPSVVFRCLARSL